MKSFYDKHTHIKWHQYEVKSAIMYRGSLANMICITQLNIFGMKDNVEYTENSQIPLDISLCMSMNYHHFPKWNLWKLHLQQLYQLFVHLVNSSIFSLFLGFFVAIHSKDIWAFREVKNKLAILWKFLETQRWCSCACNTSPSTT